MIAKSEVGAQGPIPTPIHRRPRFTRLSGAHWLMLIAGILAFLTNLVVLRGHDQTQTVTAAAIAIQPGTRMDASQLRGIPIDADADVLSSLVRWEEVSGLTGKVATRSIAVGQLVGAADFRPPAATGDQRAMSLPVEPEHAAGGKLATGDRVDVIRVVDGQAKFVVVGAEVLSVASAERGALASLADYHVVLAVDADTALALAEALDSGSIEIVRSTGAAPPSRLQLREEP